MTLTPRVSPLPKMTRGVYQATDTLIIINMYLKYVQRLLEIFLRGLLILLLVSTRQSSGYESIYIPFDSDLFEDRY